MGSGKPIPSIYMKTSTCSTPDPYRGSLGSLWGALDTPMGRDWVSGLKTDDMSLQERFPYNKTIAEVQNVYIDNGDSIYVNSPCIKARDHEITTGKTYVLISIENGTVQASSVELLDIFYHNNQIYLLLIDTESRIVKLVHQYADATDYHCTWRLLDWDYLKAEAEKR